MRRRPFDIEIYPRGKEHPLADLPLPASPLYLQMKVTDGTHSMFYWSKDGQAWNEIVGEALSAKETRSLINGIVSPVRDCIKRRSYGTGRLRLLSIKNE